MNRLLQGICILLITLICCACGGRDEGSADHSFTVFEEDGLTVAETTGGPRYEGDIFGYERVLELRSDPDAEEPLLYNPSGLTRDPDGNIYVVDDGDMSIVMFDSEGRFLRRFGREGYGPGEFRGIELPWISSGIMSVYDRWQDRVSRFDISGRLLDTRSIPSDFGYGYSATFTEQVIPIGEERIVIVLSHLGRGADMDYAGYTALLLGAGNDSLWSVSTPMIKTSFSVSFGSGGTVTPIYYGPYPSIAFSPGRGFYVSGGEEPVIDRYSLSGEKDLRIRVVLDREPVSSEEKAAVYRRMNDRIEAAEGRSREHLEAQKDALVIADEKPYWTVIRVDDAGYIWLRRSETTEQMREAGGPLYRILSPEGEYLGDTRWPPIHYSASLSHGFLLFIETDEETQEGIPVICRIKSAIDGFRYP